MLKALSSTRKLLQRSVLKHGFARSVALLSGGTAAGQLASVVLAPLITRLYRPENLGALALFASFLMVASVVVTLRYELGIVAATSERDSAFLTLTSIIFAVPVGALASLVLYIFIAGCHFGFGGLPISASFLMFPAILLTAAYTSLRYWFIREEQYKPVSKAAAIQPAGRVIAQTALGLISASSSLLIVGEVVGRYFGVTPLARGAWPKLKAQFSKARWPDVVAVLRANKKFPIYSLPSSLLDTLGQNIAVPMLIYLFGTAAGGYFGLVQKVLAVPVYLIVNSVADVFHTRVALYARENVAAVRGLFIRTALALLALGVLPTLALLCFGPVMFAFVFGAKWRAAGALAAAVAPWFLAQLVVSPLSRLVLVFSGQELKLIYDVLVIALIAGVFFFARAHHFDLFHTVLYLSIANVAAYVVYFLVLWRMLPAAHAAPATAWRDAKPVAD